MPARLSSVKRLFDITFAIVGLGLLWPAFAVLALVIKLSDGGAVFFRQERVGHRGKRFWILKFRSMAPNAEGLGLSVTKDGDPRITRVGRFMRKTKLDELPQLWNVLVGEMSFVGPRPEVPIYVQKYTDYQRRVLALKPGITDPAALEFRDEERMLKEGAGGDYRLQTTDYRLPTTDERTRTTEGRLRTAEGGEGDGVEDFYLQYCVPRKIELSLAYAERANLWTDVGVILRTVIGRRL